MFALIVIKTALAKSPDQLVIFHVLNLEAKVHVYLGPRIPATYANKETRRAKAAVNSSS